MTGLLIKGGLKRAGQVTRFWKWHLAIKKLKKKNKTCRWEDFNERQSLHFHLPVGSDLSGSPVTTFPPDLLGLSLGCTRIKRRVASPSRRWPLIWHRRGQAQHTKPDRSAASNRGLDSAVAEISWKPKTLWCWFHFHLMLRVQNKYVWDECHSGRARTLGIHTQTHGGIKGSSRTGSDCWNDTDTSPPCKQSATVFDCYSEL